MTNRKEVTAILVVVIAIFVVLMVTLLGWWLVIHAGNEKDDNAGISYKSSVLRNIVSEEVVPKSRVATVPKGDVKRLAKLAVFYQDRYSPRLSAPYWQVKMLEKLVSDFRQHYPDNWFNQLQVFLQAAFPDNYLVLLNRLEDFLAYDTWLENLSLVEFKHASERQEAIWQARLMIFGEDACQIWPQEHQEQQFAEAIAQLEDNHEQTVGDSFSAYLNAYEQTLGQQANIENDGDRGKLLTRFLSLQSVQQDLEALDTELRLATLTQLRKDVGMSDAAIARWQALDKRREDQRQQGTTYLQAVEKIRFSVTPDQVQQERARIRREIFGEQVAERIEQEEAAGYFRFQRPVIHGVN
ncbi:hypothetical protein R50073_33020 [Maricurvus nonylphenolicus]|uniref:hypothetical protein n=1 Tax=Maricurvus nonylphenolicus TaxID=1008307 RepID=UPI0036F44353